MRKLQQTLIDQIHSMITQRRSDGWYYGNKDQFEKREIEIEDWLNNYSRKNSKDNYNNNIPF